MFLDLLVVQNSIISIGSQTPGGGRNVADQIAFHVGGKKGVIVDAQDAHTLSIVMNAHFNTNKTTKSPTARKLK